MVTNVSITIPLYTLALSTDEWFSIDRCFELMGGRYEITIVAPQHLDLSVLRERYDNFRVEKFNDDYFSSIVGYNRLMLSTEFYERFLDREFLLIYQADCYLFEDSLESWCAIGYDYIGAAWIAKPHYTKLLYRMFTWIKCLFGNRYSFERLKLAVGNGGLSLRRTAKFHAITKELNKQIEFYLENCGSSIFNEDAFWALEANRGNHRLNIAPYTEALKFSFDDFPATAYELSGCRLPMGCHGWTKPRCREFWSDKIKTD